MKMIPPKSFKSQIANLELKQERTMMANLTASDLRISITLLGDELLKKVHEGGIEYSEKEEALLQRMVACYQDPIGNKKSFFQITELIREDYQITTNS